MTPKERFDAALVAYADAIDGLVKASEARFPAGTRVTAEKTGWTVTGTVKSVFQGLPHYENKHPRRDAPVLVVLPDGEAYPTLVSVTNSTLQII
jgi:hypothetical protein